MDETTGRDITETGEAGSAVLYLFSPEGYFVGRAFVTGEQIVHRVPVLLPVEALGRCHVSAWTNAGLFTVRRTICFSDMPGLPR